MDGGAYLLLLWELVGLLVLAAMDVSYSTLSPTGVNDEVIALFAIKKALNDPQNVMENWDVTSVDPCSWRMVTCSPDGHVSTLGLPSLSLSGTLSPGIGNLTNLQSVMLQNNEISGMIPDTIGKLTKLETLDLSHNKLTGEIPSSVGDLKSLNYLLLNNNSLVGQIPNSLTKVESLKLLDVSFNNLSGSVPKIFAKTFKIVGNLLICGANQNNCSTDLPEPMFPQNGSKGHSEGKHRPAIVVGVSIGSVFLVIFGVGLLLWWQYRHNRLIFFDINEQYDPEVRLGHLRRYTFKELRAATGHFNPKNVLGKGGFSVVYKGRLNDGTVIAVKRLKDYNAVGSEIQFQTEVELISLAVHKNLLRLWGFCSTQDERLLVYPYMPNGSVASRLKDCVHGRPVLDWSRRKNIALGTARGLVYLHEQCDPKIIHRDVKAANILLDEEFEAVVGDFGLAKLLDPQVSHVTTAIRGTVGHIAPEYLSTGQSSEKTDVFGFGILLLELITGQKAVDFGRGASQKGVILDWVKKLHSEGKLGQMVDRDLRGDFDRVELEEMVKVALLCTNFSAAHRPKMSEVLRMLEGDGLAEKWEQLQKIEPQRHKGVEYPFQRYSDFIEDSIVVVEAMELSGPR
ncbi:protein NSP-INTERACTING KINASE 3 [Andrographis paniculata]|uniref:protein NSP-INTERACTING KINASE 3 n=1 Tax=Andrographis paniculata TaxID=175694 RepID=UPI0021E724A1|nr:protein NSP-INTERACTING KINASE 3 [Andrographis paniculata]